MPQTRWLINNRNLFLTVLEVGESKMMALADSVSSESLLPDSLMVPSHCVLIWWKGQRSSLGLLYKGTNSIDEGSTLMT